MYSSKNVKTKILYEHKIYKIQTFKMNFTLVCDDLIGKEILKKRLPLYSSLYEE